MYKRIIVKIGSGVLMKNNQIHQTVLKDLARQVAQLKDEGVEVVLVCSGAVALGRSRLQSISSELALQSRLCAAVGQIDLMTAFRSALLEHGYTSAQILVTKNDIRNEEHRQNMQMTMSQLMQREVIPIVNENDVIVTEDLVFTDNDELAGMIAKEMGVDALFILTSVDGVLTGHPDEVSSTLIKRVTLATIDRVMDGVSAKKTQTGRGGMETKLKTAELAMRGGITVHILRGTQTNTVVDVMNGQSIGTTCVGKLL